MPRASFNFGPLNAHTMEVDYSWWGREAYYIDGQLLQQRWNTSLAGNRTFTVGTHCVHIEVSVGPKEYFTRVYVDGKVHVEELFPEVKARVEKWKRPPRSYIAPIVIAAITAALTLWVIGVWTN